MRRLYVAVYALCLILFGLLCYWVSQYQRLPGDTAVYDWFAGIDLPFAKSLMRFISFFGETIPAVVTVALVVAVLFFYRRRLEAFFVGAMPGLGLLLVWLVKTLLDRLRPNGDGLSFPSGHVTYAIVFAGLLLYLLPELVENKKLVRTLRVVMLLFIVAMVISRLYLGEHWLSDVLGGVLLGGLFLAPTMVLYENCREAKCLSCLKSKP